MNMILSFMIEVTLTIVTSALLVAYLRPFLQKILLDLCGTQERAQFWTVFSNVFLVGMPIIMALNYKPEANSVEQLFFEVARKLSGNLGGLLFALICIGFIVSVFALFARKPLEAQSK